jgi:hypothetical protein
MPAVHCSKCGKALEEIGVPPQIRLAQRYRQVINIGSESVPEEIKRDSFVYRGFFCTASRTAAASPIKRPLWVSIFAGLLAQWSLAGVIRAVQRAAERPRVSGSDSPRSRPRPTSPSPRAPVFG